MFLTKNQARSIGCFSFCTNQGERYIWVSGFRVQVSNGQLTVLATDRYKVVSGVYEGFDGEPENTFYADSTVGKALLKCRNNAEVTATEEATIWAIDGVTYRTVLTGMDTRGFDRLPQYLRAENLAPVASLGVNLDTIAPLGKILDLGGKKVANWKMEFQDDGKQPRPILLTPTGATQPNGVKLTAVYQPLRGN
jgi:hypothetical protein